ncbi:MAG TPA: sensor histidine kinase [Streptosporangiaceae bacterium]|nr:sensor histidine kinase [Streptosporangiaceae bacterium]
MLAWKPGRVVADVAVSVAAALLTTAGSWDKVAAWLPHSAIVPLALGQGLLLLARRRAPAVVLAATTLVGVFMLVVGYPAVPAVAASCCAAYALAMHGQRAQETEFAGTLRSAAGALVAAIALAVAATAPGARDQPGSWSSLTLGAMVAASWVVGYALRTRRDYVAELRERAARLEAEEGERAARAVVDERLRIARELHDVIGHSISLILIQSEAAARSVRSDPDAVPAFLSRISAASRQALAEMRGVLAVLRPEAEMLPATVLLTTEELGPQPGLEQVGDLIESLRAGGLETRLDVEPMRLPPGIALAVYRIVQESLTNVLKHAGSDAKAGVTIIRSGGTVRVSVHDDGAGPSGRAASSAHGIVGMRERVAAYAGTLRTGARPGGGFEVEASIPLHDQETL